MGDARSLLPDITDPEPRKPGRKPGSPKVPGSGRKPGSRNKERGDLRAMILDRGRPIELLCDISRGVKIRVGPQAGPDASYAYPSLQERAAAARILLDKLLGGPPPPGAEKPAEAEPEMSDREAAHRIMFLLSNSRREDRQSDFLPPTLSELAAELAADERAEAGGRDEAEKMSDHDLARRLLFMAQRAGNVTPLRPVMPEPEDFTASLPYADPPPPDPEVTCWMDENGKSHSAGADRFGLRDRDGNRHPPLPPPPTPKVITRR